MKTELQILKKNMAVKYCGETRFDYLDEDEIPLIINAMREFAKQQVKLCNKPAVGENRRREPMRSCLE